jgi:hypothetical protein
MWINYRFRPDVLRPLLPPFFRLKLVHGWAMAGICLIRLKAMRPLGFPAFCGLGSENAAHRIAVEWDEAGALREGVYVARRDTSSAWQALAGGRVFPGMSHIAKFTVDEGAEQLALQMRARDGAVEIKLRARRTGNFSPDSIFKSLAEASEFYARGSAGYSATDTPHCCDGLELCTRNWQVEPLEIQQVRSSFFDDRTLFPEGAIHLDCALLMENIEHTWRVLPRMERLL